MTRPLVALCALAALALVTGCPTPPSPAPAPDGGTDQAQDAGTDGGDPSDAGTLTLRLLAGSAGGAGTLDGPKATARFSGPVALARDSKGNVFVSDQTSCVIRKIDAAGIVSTFAGAPGECGFADAAGNGARFSNPIGLAIDAEDNLYVADASNAVIRKITSEGTVTTIAGAPSQQGTDDGTGTAARFREPTGVAIDGAGNLYVTDRGAYTIRKVTPSAEVTTIAGAADEGGYADGTGADARFNFLFGIASDEAGNLWVTEEGPFNLDVFSSPFLIRQISTDGVVTTLAGDPTQGVGNVDGPGATAQFDGLEGITRAANGDLYVVERNNNQLRRVTPAGEVATIAGAPGDGADSVDGVGTDARFGMPRGVLALPGTSGDLLVADYAGTTLRLVDADAKVTTWAGSAQKIGSADGKGGAAQFWEVSGAIDDGAGGWIVSDAQNHTLRKIAADGTVTTWLGVAGEPGDTDGTGAEVRFCVPRGLARDAAGNLYVADGGNHRIRKITPDGTVSTFAGGPGARGGGDFVDGALLDARFNTPFGLSFDSSGRLFVADAGNFAIRMIDGDQVTTIAGSGLPGFLDGTGGDTRFGLPTSVVVTTVGTLFVADSMNHAIRKVQFDGTAWQVTTFAGGLPDSLEQPSFGSEDGVGNEARFLVPQSITFAPDGNLLVADTSNHLIRSISPEAEVTTFAGQRGHAGLQEGALPASLFEPLSVRALPDGRVFGTFATGVFVIAPE